MPPVVGHARAAGRETIAALAAGTGPVAVDAERAHGFRYSQRAYLIQLRRAGSGTHLVDPIAFAPPAEGAGAEAPPADLRPLGAAIADAEWVIHAASQDLPCLYEVGLVPRTLFDTELAARLLGFPRVALGTMLEELLGVRLLKEHSASDWSTRPLPTEWLTYAALDVELLLELRDVLHARLEETGKLEWAQQEFAALVAGRGRAAGAAGRPVAAYVGNPQGAHPARARRTSPRSGRPGTTIARELDRAPGRILADVGLSELAAAGTPSRAALRQIPAFARRQARRFEAAWLAALESVVRHCARRSCRRCTCPATVRRRPGCGRPRTRSPRPGWPRSAEALQAIAEQHELPVENLLTPDYVRRLAWRPPTPVTEEAVDAALADYGARPWQRELTVAAITPLLAVVTGE